MQNVHGKEIDLLRTTVKVPGKRPPRAVTTIAPTASPKTNELTKDRSTLQLGVGATGKRAALVTTLGPCQTSVPDLGQNICQIISNKMISYPLFNFHVTVE